ncbi:MAG: diphthine--ammonia ligase [Balneolaceae bacterium]|nr:diphthine--ammonia ligase [Balneolaceae bacterium]
MNNGRKAVFNWSGGKDSSLALHHTLKDGAYDIEHLFSTINGAQDRLSMHGVRRELIEQQAKSIGIPLTTLMLPEQAGMAEYNELYGEVMKSFREQGITHSVFGDIFLEDLKTYREEQLQEQDIKAVFPIWKKKDTARLIEEFLDLGFKAISVCVKAELLGKSFVGREIDHDFVRDLPENVDPCGENGEFHTFVYDGPVFNKAIGLEKGEIVYREYNAPSDSDDQCGMSNEQDSAKMGFWFCDLLPAD